jgi:acyl-[acyl-carrier-protein]-phospholipid O-acyltransferase/long-chain-fatty-acid--[acyl-carrier-protein] ligase
MRDEQRHPLAGLLTAQFLGAFNDNAWKLFVALLGIHAVTARFEVGSPSLEAAAQSYTTMAFVIFTLPLVLVSLPAGALADRVSKRTILVVMKGIEIVLMALGTVALYLAPDGGVLLLVILGFMGAQSALFSPAKYGIMPELLRHERLSAGNALLEMWTFLAIISGTAAGAVLLEFPGSPALC